MNHMRVANLLAAAAAAVAAAFAAPTAFAAAATAAAGPKERLDDTSVAQPALFVANLAALEVLRGQDSTVVEG
jgi:malonyl CoA-acyl carrier protein transacylase